MKIEVNGTQVEVGEEFAKLSPEKQQQVVEEIAASLAPAPQAADELGEPSTINELWPALGGAAVGAIKGKDVGRAAMTGIDAAQSALRPQGAGGEKWLRNWAGMERPGVQGVPEAAQMYERSKTHGKAGEKTWKKFGNAPLDISRQAEIAAKQRRAASLPSQIVSGTKAAGKALATPTPYRFLGGALAGGLTGYDAARAWNRLKEGDLAGAAISGAGALGGALSFIPHPITRIGGAGLAGGAAMLDLMRDRNKDYENQDVEVSEEPSWQGYRAGGLAHMAGGGSPKKRTAEFLVGKVPRALGDIISKARPQQTVSNPLRMDYPGIYERPDVIARQAAENTAPENPLLKQLFGVTRDDLYEMSKRKGNEPGVIPGAAKNPKGSAAAEAIMTPQNEQRILDIMSELQTNAPGMYRGMHAWYTMDPMYQRLVQLVGKDEAGRLYKQLNVFGGIESPNMPVPNEFRRASAAHMMAEQGRFPEWQKFGGLKAEQKLVVPEYPADLMSVPGRVGHQRASTSQEKYLRTGQHGMDSPKAPPYIQASSVPELGFQTDIPVGDAHWSRGVGLADVRTGKSTAESVSTPEIQQLAPWWRERIAGQMGTESVPAQGILWGGLGKATGVKTAVGAPKLELQAIEIGNAARRLGISPEEARDLILLGKERAGKKAGGPVHLAKGGDAAKKLAKMLLPPAENAARTQIIGTLPTYEKAGKILQSRGAAGRGLDFGAGLGEGAKRLPGQWDTYEPFAKGWKPTYSDISQVPEEAYGQLTNLNVLNVVPREARDEIVQGIGRSMEPGGLGIITTRGADVMKAKGRPGPEPMSIITSRDTYQKGYTPAELQEYLKYMLGEGYDIERLGLGPAGAMIRKKAEGGLAHMAKGGKTPAWQRKEGQNPEGGLNAAGRASYKRETGGTLKRPQPEGGPRRDSFCARMKGLKKKLTSAKTANDPDSRVNKSLRKWNC